MERLSDFLYNVLVLEQKWFGEICVDRPALYESIGYNWHVPLGWAGPIRTHFQEPLQKRERKIYIIVFINGESGFEQTLDSVEMNRRIAHIFAIIWTVADQNWCKSFANAAKEAGWWPHIAVNDGVPTVVHLQLQQYQIARCRR